MYCVRNDLPFMFTMAISFQRAGVPLLVIVTVIKSSLVGQGSEQAEHQREDYQQENCGPKTNSIT